MANPEHVKRLRRGTEIWNRWREENAEINPDLTGAQLARYRHNIFGKRLSYNLGHLNLRATFLQGADLSYANLSEADLTGANLKEANLDHVDLANSRLRKARFTAANLAYANLANANLDQAYLDGTNLTSAVLDGTSLTEALVGRTTFADINLSGVRHLDTVQHSGPSEISVSTLYKSGGRIPESFLRGCGIPHDFIVFLPSLIGAQEAIQFYSCFISYSHKDEEFTKRLHSRMRDAHLRVWFAPVDIRGGEKIYDQIDVAIRYFDKILVVLSESSLRSEWVKTEIRKARRLETEQDRRKLFPIRVVDFETIKKWTCFDADAGKDLAVELREYFIPDFSNWKDHDAFEAGFSRLLEDLKAPADKGQVS
jgi:hypothetical protein